MKITLGNNIASLQAQRQLQDSGETLSRAYERLSSGMRINRASDDAAGLAIADSLKADARVYGTAMRNISDGVSMLNIMDSALASQSGIITRLQELAEQSANGVYSNDQRDALNTEYQALVDEFGRIGDSTEFNGVKLLSSDENGETGTIALQVGIKGGKDSIISLDTKDTGSYSGTLNATGDYTGDGRTTAPDFTEVATSHGVDTPEEFFEKFGQNYYELSITDSNGEERTVLGLIVSAGFGGTPSDQPGILDIVYEGDDGIIHSAGSIGLLGAESGTIALTFTEFGTTGDLSYDFKNTLIRPEVKYGSEEESAIDFTGVGTRARGLHALEVTARRADEVNQIRGEIGGVQSRLTTALSVSQQARENSLAAESRIRDSDVAADTAGLTRAQILQQVGARVLSQANQQPALALQLLRE